MELMEWDWIGWSGVEWGDGRVVPGDGSLDRIVVARRLNNKPEQNIDHVHDPNGRIEVKTVTEHELPWRERLALQGLNGTIEGEC